MLAVFVLRLLAAELSGGRVVGHVEDVASGGTTYIRSAEELLGYLAAQPVSEKQHQSGQTQER